MKLSAYRFTLRSDTMNYNLPPLPPKRCALFHPGGRLDYYGEHQMREYGQLCRQQALEDAAKVADLSWVKDPRVTASDAIRSLLK